MTEPVPHQYYEPLGPGGGGAFCKTCGYIEHNPLYLQPFERSDQCSCDFCRGIPHLP